MAHVNTILHQLLQILPLDEFDLFVGQHKADKYVKSMTCRNQLTTMLYAQATGKDSLRDIETGLRILDSTWYHLGLASVARSTLAYTNKHRPHEIYESLFYSLLKKCHSLSPETHFPFRNDLHAIDSTTVDLCLSLFEWAKFRKAKGAIKLHVDFNIRDQIPELIIITDGKKHDVKVSHEIDFSSYPKGTIFVIDKAYYDFSFLRKIKDAGHHFVICLKSNANIVRFQQHRNPVGKGVLADERIALILDKAVKNYPYDLRLVTYFDEEHKVLYEFLTDEFRLSAINIALIYKRRWDIELFFKWIKQHLKVKTFLGTSENAVKTQIWIAMIYFLLVSWIKFQAKFKGTLLELTRMLKETFLWRIHLVDILSLTLKTTRRANPRIRGTPQLSFF